MERVNIMLFLDLTLDLKSEGETKICLGCSEIETEGCMRYVVKLFLANLLEKVVGGWMILKGDG